MIIDVVDMEDSALGHDRQSQLKINGANSTIITMYGMSNGIAQMITDISKIAGYGSVEVLRIWSHGRPGGQTVSGGHGGEAYRVAHWTGISVANIGAMRSVLTRLNPYLARGARIELRGCDVGAGTDGERLIGELARIWRSPVQAGTTTQYHVDWDGPVIEASSDGGFRSVIGTTIKQAANMVSIFSAH